jgi:hypothetical protein
MWPMVAAQFLKTRVSLKEKQRVHALASQLIITESVWLKRLVIRALGESAASLPEAIASQGQPERHTRDARLSVRLRPEDRLLLYERAAARGMASATYASVLVRAHLRRHADCRRKSSWPSSAASRSSELLEGISTRLLAR